MWELPDNLVLVGVDGGASEVKAHQVLVLSSDGGLTLGLGAASASCCYDHLPGFEPVSMAQQLIAFERGVIEPTEAEREQGRLWIEAAATSIASVAHQAGREVVRVGMCMPGLKTADGRGIAVMRHGPRAPAFLEALEARLSREGVVVAEPIPPLTSDGDACGVGENVDAHGLFRGVANAYYLGGGTGLSEAFKLYGRCVPFDAARAYFKKAWQLESEQGASFEDLVSAGGMNARYAERAQCALPVADQEFPEQRAAHGDELAAQVVREAADALAELVVHRLVAMRVGRSLSSQSRARSVKDPFRGGAFRLQPNTCLDRVVLGQRVGRIYAASEQAGAFHARVDECLARRIEESRDLVLRSSYLDGAALKPGFLCASTLRAAPALGAAALALESKQVRLQSKHDRTHGIAET